MLGINKERKESDVSLHIDVYLENYSRCIFREKFMLIWAFNFVLIIHVNNSSKRKEINDIPMPILQI